MVLPIKSEIMDGFWSSRCLKDHLDRPDEIGSFLSSATTPMVVKKELKKSTLNPTFPEFVCNFALSKGIIET